MKNIAIGAQTLVVIALIAVPAWRKGATRWAARRKKAKAGWMQ